MWKNLINFWKWKQKSIEKHIFLFLEKNFTNKIIVTLSNYSNICDKFYL
jgi:hypothetical protein